MMRFVALALTVLLTGCQARFLQDEVSSQLDQTKSALQVYADQLKQFAHKALTHFDDTEFNDYKEFLGQSVDNLHGYFQAAFQAITPFGNQVLEATSPIREKWTKDIKDLRKQLEPKREELRQVLVKHFEKYRDKFKPFLKEQLDIQHRHYEEVRTKLDPMVRSLKEEIRTNWEETKSKLLPIAEAVREKLMAELQEVKAQLEPYIKAYKDQMEQRALEFRKSARSGKLRKKMNELGEQVKPHFEAIFVAVQRSLSKE